jgi:hypothetical protein
VLLIALRGLPRAYRDAAAAAGQTLTIDITGAAGGVWTLRRDDDGWSLWADDGLLTRSGDASLFGPLLGARSVIV